VALIASSVAALGTADAARTLVVAHTLS